MCGWSVHARRLVGCVDPLALQPCSTGDYMDARSQTRRLSPTSVREYLSTLEHVPDNISLATGGPEPRIRSTTAASSIREGRMTSPA